MLHPSRKRGNDAATLVVARIGMRCQITLDNGCEYVGAIVQMFDDTCVVRLDEPRDTSDGDAPNVACVEWSEVQLVEVRPDAAQVTEKTMPSGTVSERVNLLVRPGLRVEIDIGDGDSDKNATVIAAMPECCVVRLDKPLKYGGSHHAAADWRNVRVVELAPELSAN